MISIFLSYAKEDEENVIDLYDRLKQEGYNPWLDTENLLPGQNWQAVVPKAIKDSDIFIGCFSSLSSTKHSYVQREFKIALNEQANKPPGTIHVIPLRLDMCTIPEIRQEECGMSLKDIQSVDLFAYNGFERLVNAIDFRFRDIYQDQHNRESDYIPAETYDDSYNIGEEFAFFDLLKWGLGGLLVLSGIGSIAGGGGGTDGLSQPGGIVRSQKVIVRPKTGNCQPLRKEADSQSELLGCVYEGKELIAVSDELQNGWVKVQGSANGIGWMYYHGLSRVAPDQ